RPKANKHAKIVSLLTPFTYNKMHLLDYSSRSAFSDIYSYNHIMEMAKFMMMLLMHYQLHV
ncbi:hypothetical protein, partial [Borrelia duttonii]|uniref:hypothetical protein n=1 Tax=Borrelia duttonii TaxID=40834 RepID=UPI001E4A554A